MESFVTISGDKDAIEELEKVCKSPELFVGREKGQYVLKSKDFDELNSVEDVHKEACKTVALLNGAVKCALGYKGNLNVEMIVKVGDRGQWDLHGIASGEGKGSGKLIMEMTKADGTVISEAAHVPQFVLEAMSNEKVAKVLRLIAEDNLDWNKLNILFEDVQGDIGSKINEWVDSIEVNRFTQTVQDKRHGESGLKKHKWQPHKNPMNFDEARSFILHIVENWLNSRIVGQVPVHKASDN